MEKKNKTKNKKQQQILVLLDVHAILHRAYHAMPNFFSKKGEPTGALYGVCAMIIKIIADLKPDYIIACYDLPKPTFRHEVYAEYKQGRAKSDEELVVQIKRSRDIFDVFEIPIYEAEGFEADDILGTIVKKVKQNKNLQTIIASGDMDTLQLVDDKQVCVYTLKKGINDTILYDEKAVIDRFGFVPDLLPDYKGLRGDPSDNIIGIKGIGEKTATTLITQFGSIEKIYKALKNNKQAFLDLKITPRIIQLLIDNKDEALFSKTLATIRLDAPIDFEIPKTIWNETIDINKVDKLFNELDFRNMSARLKNTIKQEEPQNAQNTAEEKDSENKKGEINEEELCRAKIALWLINSDSTNPTLEDILTFTGKENFKEAVPVLLEELKEKKITKLYYDIELPLIPILDAAQKRGIIVDVPHFQNLSKTYHQKLDSLEKEIWKMAGEEFNINSPKQLAEILFDKMQLSVKGLKKTAGGARSTRESELVKLQNEHKIIAVLLDYRELQKLLSTYIDTIPQMVNSNSRVHSTLHQTGTTTGRMSSSNPNMQNIPAHSEMSIAIRKGFVATEGFSLVALDYSQIEVRVLAMLSKDKKLTDIFHKKEDIHAAMAAFMFEVHKDEVTKEMRREAKVVNFGMIYGMGINALHTQLGGTRAEAQEFYNNYFRKFPTIKKYFEETKQKARDMGYTETLFGRRRYFGGMTSHIPYIRAMAERMAVNAPIQGTAADIIKIAMRAADEELQKKKYKDDTHLILQVHDELIYEIKNEKIDDAIEIISEAMRNISDFSIPLEVSVSVGQNLGEMETYKQQKLL